MKINSIPAQPQKSTALKGIVTKSEDEIIITKNSGNKKEYLIPCQYHPFKAEPSKETAIAIEKLENSFVEEYKIGPSGVFTAIYGKKPEVLAPLPFTKADYVDFTTEKKENLSFTTRSLIARFLANNKVHDVF